MNNSNDPLNPEVSQSWILADFECKNRRTRRLQETSLLKNGATINHQVSDQWEYPIPGSLQDIAFSYVCLGKDPSSQSTKLQPEEKTSWREKVTLVEDQGRNLLADFFVTVNIDESVSVRIPRTWTVLNQKEKTKIDDIVKSQTKNLSIDSNSQLPFAANFYDQRGQAVALFSLRKYPEMDVSQSYIRAAGQQEILDIDQEIRASIILAGQKQGYEVKSWNGTKLQSLNGKLVLVTEYTREFPGKPTFRVRLVRLLDDDNSFTAIISYQVDQGEELEWITDKMIDSIESHK